MDLSEEWITPLIKQTWVVSGILLQLMGHGMAIGITSSMVPALLAPDSPMKINLDQSSWISAVIGLGRIVGYVIFIYSMATYGRRITIMIGLVASIAGPLICYFVTHITVFIFGRFLAGIGTSTALMSAIVIAEFTSPQYRGVFLNLKSEAQLFGFLVVHILNHYLHWRTVLLVATAPYLMNLAMAYTWTESPFWLASKHRFDECKISFYWLRGTSVESTRELNAMITAQREQGYDLDTTLLNSTVKFLKKFKQKNFLKPLGTYMFAMILLEFTGRHVFPAYALQIVYELNPDRSNAFYYIICIDMLQNVGAIISAVLTKIMKRRTLLFSSGVSSVVILFAVCIYDYLRSLSLISQNYNAIPLLLFGTYFVVLNLGCNPLCLSLAGEIFPLEHRPTATACSGIIKSIVIIVTLKFAPIMLVVIKIYGTFSIYGVVMSICLLVLYIYLPETKDKTLQEIECYFNGKKKKGDDGLNEEAAMLTDVDSAVRREPRIVTSSGARCTNK